jgi:hypothetical protein
MITGGRMPVAYEEMRDIFTYIEDSLDLKLWIHKHTGDGWLPQWNSWHRMQAEKVEKDLEFVEVDFNE